MLNLLFEGVHTNHVSDGFYTINPLTSSSCLIRHEGTNILVDPGAFSHTDQLLAGLSKAGLSPSDIHYVVNTHYHLDHTSNNYLFKHSVIYAPRAVLYPDGRCDIYPDSEHRPQIPGIMIFNTPGHVLSHCSVLHEHDGKKYVVAGDAVRETSLRGTERHSCEDMTAYLKSLRKIFDMADVIIPGHGRVIEGKVLEELKKMVEKL